MKSVNRGNQDRRLSYPKQWPLRIPLGNKVNTNRWKGNYDKDIPYNYKLNDAI